MANCISKKIFKKKPQLRQVLAQTFSVARGCKTLLKLTGSRRVCKLWGSGFFSAFVSGTEETLGRGQAGLRLRVSSMKAWTVTRPSKWAELFHSNASLDVGMNGSASGAFEIKCSAAGMLSRSLLAPRQSNKRFGFFFIQLSLSAGDIDHMLPLNASVYPHTWHPFPCFPSNSKDR